MELTALMRYGNQEAEYSCYAHIYPPVKTPRERLEAELLNEVSKADEKSIHEDTLSLPRQVDGRSVSWASQEGGEGIVLIMLVPAAALAVFWQRDKRLEKLEQQRKNQLILDYPDLLFKLTMLLGAGMTIKGAFVKLPQSTAKGGAGSLGMCMRKCWSLAGRCEAAPERHKPTKILAGGAVNSDISN